MSFVPCTTAIYSFSKNHQPVRTVQSGETFVIETYDCFQNQITSSETPFDSIDWNHINPATGPIYIEGAEPGDILAVKIEQIRLKGQGVMAVGPGLGVLGDRIPQFEAKMIPVEENRAVFDEHLSIPLNPMIGVIGVAPSGEDVSCGTPGPHGGNMDTKLITTGATVYFPVFVKGALFALGDLHAAMGDGEIGVSGIEIPGEVTVTVRVMKGYSLNHPLLQNDDGIATIVSAKTLDEAVKQSVTEMVDLLLPHTPLTLNHLTMVLSAAGQTQISQVVDPLVTARFFVPRFVLEAYGIRLFED
ncbi:acetamidase/formamidase family protein [Geobacillus stearothermophilus]|nr:acetamidase/formamidase family protein [Geobacillus stearothermophilus]